MYGTGNQIVRPPIFVQNNELLDSQLPGPPIIKQADFVRVSTRQAPVYLSQTADASHSSQTSPDEPAQQFSQVQINGLDDHHSASSHNPRRRNSPPQTNPPSQPPPASNALAGSSLTSSNSISISSARVNRQSMPLPDVPLGGSRGIEESQTPPPPIPQPQQPSGNTILFYGQ